MADKKEIINRINNVIKNIENKDFTLFFFVIDSKNVPNSSMKYSYTLAYELQLLGYNVKMIYQLANEYTKKELDELNRKEKPIDESRAFVGVREWLGDKYADIKHINITTEEWRVSPADVLFIPEVFSSLMFETYKHNIPCKRYVLLHNYDYVTEFIPLGIQWSSYGIYDAICSTKQEEKLIKSVFPYINTTVLNPYIDNCFRKPIKPKNLIINIIAKNQNDVNKIVKPFYWKYGNAYKFVSFRDLRGFPQEKYAEMLQESPITIWVDTDTSFGSSAIEAIRCNSILIGKLPERIPEWMTDENGVLKDNGIWFDDINAVHGIIASAVGSWMRDEVPSEILNAMEVTNKQYTYSEWKPQVKVLIEKITTERINELKNTITKIKEEN